MTPMMCPITDQTVLVNPDSVENFLKLGYAIIKDNPKAVKKTKAKETDEK